IMFSVCFFFFQAEDGIRDRNVTGVQTCALPIYSIESCEEWQSHRKKQPLITVHFYKRSGIYILICKNNSLPIPATILDHLFVKYGKTTKAGKHKGLGTKIIDDIVKSQKFNPTPSSEKVEERENIIKRDFSTTMINQKWVGDITYIHTLRDGWCYLASVLDLHSRKVIGYSFSRSMTTELVEKALENAYVTQKPNDGVIFHSDLGSQYTSDDFAEKIQSYKMTHSFSHK